MKAPRLIFSALTVGGWTLISRVLGFFRDLILAAYLGAGPVAEAFQAAFSLPNLFRRFFAEGAFNLAFVPLYTKKIADKDGAARFAGEALGTLAGILILLTILAQLFMPALVYMIASGFAEDGRFALTVGLSRIIFPYILFISLAAVIGGILNAHRHFAAAAAAPVLLNVILIATLLLTDRMGWNLGNALAWGVALAGIAQLALVWIAVQKLGIRISWHIPKFSPEMKHLLKIALPALLTGGVIQINLLVGRQIASFTEGAYVWLYMADRLYQLPLGVVGIAIGVVLLPELSKHLAKKDTAAGNEAFNRALGFAAFLTFPSAMALGVAALPISSVLFERGAYTATDSANTAAALAIYAIGLPAFVLQKIYQPLFFAREDTKTPFYFALAALIVNAVVALALLKSFGFLSAAIGTTCSAWAMFALLAWRAGKLPNDAARMSANTKIQLLGLLGACLILGGVLWVSIWVLGSAFYEPQIRYIALAGLIAIGILTYLAAALAFRGISRDTLRKALRR